MENQHPITRATVHAHKNQFIWQILVPFLIMAVMIITGAVLIVSGEQLRYGVWSDISVIWLLTPVLFFALAILIILVTAIYGMIKLLQVLPFYTGKAQDIFDILSAGMRKITNGVSSPIMWIRQAEAVIKSIIKF
jgi:hypothetical protein